jgi:glycosyltransferase involved in cell wall biosynthesis
MKLLTVNYECPPQGGGAGAVMLSLLDSFRRQGAVQTAVCGWDFRLGGAPAVAGVDMNFVPVHRVSPYTTGVRAIAEFLLRARRTLRGIPAARYQLAHFHFSVPTGLLGGALRGQPFVCSLHGIDVPGFVNEAAGLQKLTAALNRRVMKRASRLFAPSHRVAELVMRHCPEARVQVIPHGVDADAFQFKTAYARTPSRLVTIARLLPWKRIDRLVQAVAGLKKQAPGLTLDIYGDGEERGRIQSVIAAAGAEGYVTVRGMVARAQLQTELCGYDAFVLPSITEAFGLVFLEAMAAGLPVIGYNSAGPADIIEHGSTGLLFEHDTVEDLTRVLAQLLTTDGLAEQLGRQARLTAQSRFSWDVIARRYLDAFDSVISNSVD